MSGYIDADEFRFYFADLIALRVVPHSLVTISGEGMSVTKKLYEHPDDAWACLQQHAEGMVRHWTATLNQITEARLAAKLGVPDEKP